MEQTILQVTPLSFPWDTSDPFIFCVHHEDFYPKGNGSMGPDDSLVGRPLGNDFAIKDGYRMYHGREIPGFPAHPHRGFETVTIVTKGLVDHFDSLGASGRFGNGDVQWMTAGRGVQHSEMFPLLKDDEDNPLELFQIWLNLPKVTKMAEPHYAMLWREEIPIVRHTDPNGKQCQLRLIAGTFDEETAAAPPPNSWAADAGNEVGIWLIEMEAGAKWQLPALPDGIQRSVYLYKGEGLRIGDELIDNYCRVKLGSGSAVALTAEDAEVKLLVLQGKAIDEPVVQHGPFVANSAQEIQNAFHSFQATQFGGWPWGRLDPVHPKEKGRFAQFADGTVLERD